MSEYQYYEFQAIDRPLTETEMRELRSCSTRATISATRFVNHYEWGNFKGNPSTWMEKYFDAFLYVANWGTHKLMLRLPRQILDLKTAKQYCCSEVASARIKGDFIILELHSEDEDGDDEWDDGSGWLSSLIPLRADLVAGDHRVLYLAWLLCAQTRKLKDNALEPTAPPGLGNLTASLQAFADFLRIDNDLIQVAAVRSPEASAPASDKGVEKWIAALPDAKKTDWLVRLAGGKEPHLRAELLRRFRGTQTIVPTQGDNAPRTVKELLAAADQRAEIRRQEEAKRMAIERAKREREEAVVRERYFDGLAKREAEAWCEVDTLVATKQPGKYDEAVQLLRDLQELSLRRGKADEVESRLLGLCDQHSRKPSFLERLKKAGLARSGA